ncbi:hypothetical protein NC651_038823 [Populus alba x Populus x berolinensis]|nr:hypothetical protein NC651_038823 [Populus alba x Populus x berolinensis]
MIFTYGTLKRGFSNHVLRQDLFKTGMLSLMESTGTSRDHYERRCRVWGGGVLWAQELCD